MPIRQIWDKKAPRQDLGKMIGNPATELTVAVKKSLRRIESPDPLIGLMGFEIDQMGLTYTVRYKDDKNNDRYSFEVKVPDGKPYLRRMKDKMIIAEKAHALMLVSQSLTNDVRLDIGKHLAELEYACFDKDSGTVHNIQTRPQTTVKGAKALVHYGLSFPPNEDYERAPEVDIKAFEWLSHNRYHLIDCSEGWPYFITASAGNPALNRMYMSAEEAKAAFKHIEMQAMAEGGMLMKVLTQHQLLPRISLAAGSSGVFRTPAGP